MVVPLHWARVAVFCERCFHCGCCLSLYS